MVADLDWGAAFAACYYRHTELPKWPVLTVRIDSGKSSTKLLSLLSVLKPEPSEEANMGVR